LFLEIIPVAESESNKKNLVLSQEQYYDVHSFVYQRFSVIDLTATKSILIQSETTKTTSMRLWKVVVLPEWKVFKLKYFKIVFIKLLIFLCIILKNKNQSKLYTKKYDDVPNEFLFFQEIDSYVRRKRSQ
jgi:hypothetical protein